MASLAPGGMEVPRVLGRLDGDRRGPTLVCVGGLHGNEPAGVLGLQRVLEALEDRAPRMRGSFVALAGNLGALRAGRRFVDRDLNRAWTRDRTAAVRSGDRPGGDAAAEDLEQRELAEAIARAVERAPGPVYFLDLHTTSGAGGPFTTVSDTLPNRAFALSFPVPLILGLEELVDGTLLEHLGERGFVSAVFESGQHEEPAAVERAAAAVWIALAATGLFTESELPELPGARKRLLADTRHLPRVLEMRHRHGVRDGDDFAMHAGFENFQRVRRGEPLATDDGGEVVAPESARILMPLYQAQGNDGFFIVREFRPFWLHVSTALRHLGLGSVVHWLPGIRRHPDDPHALVVDRRIARWYAVQLLHLLGFRKHLDRGDRLVVVRRRFDTRSPERVAAPDEPIPGGDGGAPLGRPSEAAVVNDGPDAGDPGGAEPTGEAAGEGGGRFRARRLSSPSGVGTEE